MARSLMGIIRAVENLYDRAQSAVLFNGCTGKRFSNTWRSVPTRQKWWQTIQNDFQREIKIKSQRLEEVENFKYFGAIISNEGSKPEILSRIAQTTAALSRLKIIWRDKNISLASKVKLVRTLILSTFLYACEGWTLTAEIERRIQALDMRCYRRLFIRRDSSSGRASASCAVGQDMCRIDTWPRHTKDVIKMVPVATLLGAQHYKASTGFSSLTNHASLTSHN